MPSFRQSKGANGEAIAARLLQERGYRVLERNYRFKKAEIDLIASLPTKDAEHEHLLIFVEVKWRRNADFAAPESAVNLAKRRRLVLAAEAFLRDRKLEHSICRFDIVALTGDGRGLQIDHIESAFDA